jgi:predicted Zn-ribbon and HTH transcriptional regulator/predicted transcriptional regulator
MDNYELPENFHYPMETTIQYNNLTIRGKQRVAVFKALRVPSSGRRILAMAKQTAPSMTYQDLRHILRNFQSDGIVICLNPENQTGRIYTIRSIQDEKTISPELIDICARIDRAKTRLAVLKEVGKERYFETEPLTATRIKKLMRESHPLGLNHVLAALQFLEERDLVEVVDRTDKRELKIYDITRRGRTVLEKLQPSDQ